MNATLPVEDLHVEYKLWIAELNFDLEMLNIFELHLENIIPRNGDNKDVLAQTEHFQNQFICQREIIDQLKHDLNVSEKQLASFTNYMLPVGYEFERLDNHPQLRERLFMHRKIFKDLKGEFRLFESELI